MRVENHVYPQSAQLRELAKLQGESPIVMINLLKFREVADYGDGRSERISGREAYMRYADQMTALVAARGGRVLFSTDITGLVIGEVEKLWDAFALVEYPSAAAFAAIATSPEVAEIGKHRAAGLEGQLLIRSQAMAPGT